MKTCHSFSCCTFLSRHQAATAVAATVACSLLAAGCGGGGHGGGTVGTPDSATETTQARTELSTLLSSSSFDTNGLNGIDSGKLTSIRDHFALAYAANSQNTEAAFGLAVTDLAVNAQSLVVSEGAVAETRGAQATSARRPAASVARTTALNAFVRPLLLGGGRDVRTLAKSRAAMLVALPLLQTRQTTTSISTVTMGFQSLLAALNRDLPLLALAANDPQFSFPMTGIGGSGVTTTLDEADARAFEAGAFGARAGVQMALAYDLDPRSFDLTTPVSQAFDAMGGGVPAITPAQYLPPAPFGQLQSNGKALFASAKSDLALVITTVQSDVPLFKARTGTATRLFPTSDLTSADYSSLQLGLSAAQYALDHAVTTGGVTYNLPAWFANPPASLTALEPNYRSVGGGYAASASDYPDKTFGGLVSGLPDSAFSAQVDSDATYGDLAVEGFFAPLENLFPDDSSDD